MESVLVIDDHPFDRKIARESLTAAGFAVEEAPDGAAGLRLFFESRSDVVVLDVLMPGMDGWTVCERIRELSGVPIIMLTSLNREEEMVRGLDLGADDFLAKPVSPAHLVARVRALLRRTREAIKDAWPTLYRDDRLSIDTAERRVVRDGKAVELTPTEFKLLVTLASAPNRAQSYSTLLSTVWGPEYVDDIDFLRVYLWRLRKKLEPEPENPRWLRTDRGFGYRFARP